MDLSIKSETKGETKALGFSTHQLAATRIKEHAEKGMVNEESLHQYVKSLQNVTANKLQDIASVFGIPKSKSMLSEIKDFLFKSLPSNHIDAAKEIKRQAEQGETTAREIQDYVRSIRRLPKTKLKAVADIFGMYDIDSMFFDIEYKLTKLLDKSKTSSHKAPVKQSSSSNDTDKVLQAFDQADRGRNYVNIADIMDKLPGMSKQSVHSAINKLRRDGVFYAGAYEGRDGMSSRELNAGIRDGSGTIFGYLSRKSLPDGNSFTLIDDDGQSVATIDLEGNITPSNPELQKWLQSGVPGIRGNTDGDIVYDYPGRFSPDHPLFWLALVEKFHEMGWNIISTNKAFCKVGQTVANTNCTPKDGRGSKKPTKNKLDPNKLPTIPKFISSNAANVHANEKACFELRQLAAVGDLQGLTNHQATPSPKVQAYKTTLMGIVQKFSSPVKVVKTPKAAKVSQATVPTNEGEAPVSQIRKKIAEDIGYDAGTIKQIMNNPVTIDNEYNAVARSQIASYIHHGKLSHKNAVLKVLDLGTHSDAQKQQWLKQITKGNLDRAIKEYQHTPLCDLHVLKKIEVVDYAVSGQAVCYMGTRSVKMGTTSVTGDFRHELGHAIHAFFGPGYMDDLVKSHYNSVMQKVKANPAGKLEKLSHDWYEENYGVIGSRALDSKEEDMAEHYRGYHKAVYSARVEHDGGKALERYRKLHPEMAGIFDAHYTAVLLGSEDAKQQKYMGLWAVKSSPFRYRVKANMEGQPCTPGHTELRDGCIPKQGGSGTYDPKKEEPKKRIDKKIPMPKKPSGYPKNVDSMLDKYHAAAIEAVDKNTEEDFIGKATGSFKKGSQADNYLNQLKQWALAQKQSKEAKKKQPTTLNGLAVTTPMPQLKLKMSFTGTIPSKDANILDKLQNAAEDDAKDGTSELDGVDLSFATGVNYNSLLAYKQELVEWVISQQETGASVKPQAISPTYKLANSMPDKPKLSVGAWGTIKPEDKLLVETIENLAFNDAANGTNNLSNQNLIAASDLNFGGIYKYYNELMVWISQQKKNSNQSPAAPVPAKPKLPQTVSHPNDPDYVDVTGWQKVDGQIGSNPGGVYLDLDGNKYYVKHAKSLDHAKNEVLAAKLYELADAAVTSYQLWEENGKSGTASKWEEHAPSKFDFNDKESAAENFAVHAWLGNLDAVGTSFDNQVWVTTTEGKKLKTVDTGGSMIFRAQGDPKDFTDDVTEWDSMRDATNPKAANSYAVFGSMTNDQLIESANKLNSVSDSDIEKLVDKLGPKDKYFKLGLTKTLINRKKWITDWAKNASASVAKGNPILVSSGGSTFLPPKPILTDNKWNKSPIKKIDIMYEFAEKGKISELEAVYVNPDNKSAVSQKLHAYKTALLAALKGGATAPIPISTPGQQVKPSPFKKPAAPKKAKTPKVATPAPIKIDPKKFPVVSFDMPAEPNFVSSNVAQVEANKKIVEQLKQFATANDLSSIDALAVPPSPKLQEYKADVQSHVFGKAIVPSLLKFAEKGYVYGLQNIHIPSSYTKLESYRQQLIANVQNQLNPPKPPTPYNGALDALTKVFGGMKAATPSTQKIGYFLKTEDPGVPVVNVIPIQLAIDNYPPKLVDPDMHKKYTEEPYAAMSSNAANIIKNYTGSYHSDYNDVLHKGVPDSVPGLVDAVKEYINKSPELPVGTFMTRKIDLSDDVKKQIETSVGSVLQETGFSSCSINGSWSGNVEFHITTIPGVKAMYAGGGWSQHPSEGEIVMPPGSRFLINKTEKKAHPYGGYEKLIVHCYALPTVPEQCC